jgi:hypothetical protein
MKTNNIFLMGRYCDAEQSEYLMEFRTEEFEFEGKVKSLGVELLMPSMGRIANVYLIDRTAEEVTSLQNQGHPKPAPVGRLEFTLWRDGRREIRRLW